MSHPILEELPHNCQVAGLSVTQYEAMIRSGILPEGEAIELIDGLLVYKDRAETGDDPMQEVDRALCFGGEVVRGFGNGAGQSSPCERFSASRAASMPRTSWLSETPSCRAMT